MHAFKAIIDTERTVSAFLCFLRSPRLFTHSKSVQIYQTDNDQKIKIKMIIVIIADQYTKKKEVEKDSRCEKVLIVSHSVQIASYLFNFILFKMIFFRPQFRLSIESVWAT